ncbi:2-dehydro-3-deoxyphosphogluconate aldolase [Sorangium cellulosum]|uniref:2-dehydro-3-deoxyphosphogluconate aldolase n=1 Tax=Sorangium cellulosum TaxID=56 RepID=A0A2L0EZ99_SORCE|nr:bifunctional 4-hydroxy-2-oxoglutarate aldolase/2-dehydro-3-deoxy-phosphogluconate aldolase [Sorangium cellulosum]AUX44559.1 2-dehydro-3-deoxyphosphogluconate aldolase [Sorangium cellulosum]
MNREQVVRRIEEIGIVPVVRAPRGELAVRAARALCAGGIEVIEITMTVPDALSVMHEIASRMGDHVLVGAGTVLTADAARGCIEAGAEFIVSPGLDLEVIRAAHDLGKAVFPGALTPTEVITAWNAGADTVKLFPCSAMGGAKYLRALRAPLPEVKLMPTGGVNLTTARDFIEAGAVALGVGGELVDAAALAAGKDEVLTERAREFMSVVSAARAELRNSARA